MTPTLTYLLKVMICSGLFISLYMLAFHKKVQYSICRAYLMATMALSVIIPAMNVPLYKGEPVEMLNDIQVNITRSSNNTVNAMPVTTAENVTKTDSVSGTNPTATIGAGHKNVNWILIVYWGIATIMLVIIMKGLVPIAIVFRKNNFRNHQNCHIVESNHIDTPFTFFRTVYIGTNYSDNERQQILSHELSHARHFHSFEKLAMSILRALFWLNPFFWLAERRLEEVQEWQADSDAIGEGYEISKYQQTIFKQIFGCSPELASGMSNSFTKNRFIMMTKKLNRKGALPIVSAIIIATGMFLCFGCTSNDKHQTQYLSNPNAFFAVDNFFDNTEGITKRYSKKEKEVDGIKKSVEVFEDYSNKKYPIVVLANGLSSTRNVKSRALNWVDNSTKIILNDKKITYEEFKELSITNGSIYYMKDMDELSFVYIATSDVTFYLSLLANETLRVDTLCETDSLKKAFRGIFNMNGMFMTVNFNNGERTTNAEPYMELFINGHEFENEYYNRARNSNIRIYKNQEAQARFGEQHRCVLEITGSFGATMSFKNSTIEFNNQKCPKENFFNKGTETSQLSFEDIKKEIDFDNEINAQWGEKTRITIYRDNSLLQLLKQVKDSLSAINSNSISFYIEESLSFNNSEIEFNNLKCTQNDFFNANSKNNQLSFEDIKKEIDFDNEIGEKTSIRLYVMDKKMKEISEQIKDSLNAVYGDKIEITAIDMWSFIENLGTEEQ